MIDGGQWWLGQQLSIPGCGGQAGWRQAGGLSYVVSGGQGGKPPAWQHLPCHLAAAGPHMLAVP